MRRFLEQTGQTKGLAVIFRGNARSPMPFAFDVYRDTELVGSVIVRGTNTAENRLRAGAIARQAAERDFGQE